MPMTAYQTENSPYVLVGIDGSLSALDAAAWAAESAAARNVPLRLVHVVDPGEAQAELGPWSRQRILKYLESKAVAVLAEAQHKVADLEPEVAVETSCLTGRPLPTLIALSREALMTVVGSGRSDPASASHAGSVAVSMSAHAYGPVVVVRGTCSAFGDDQRQGVVVGVDSSEAADKATEWAFSEAALRGVDLTAVFSCGDLPRGLDDSEPEPRWWLEYQVQQKQVLTRRLGQWSGCHPGVVAHCEVTTGRPAWALMQHAREAQLIVVGSRGRSEFVGSVLGSTSHALIHHAPCPVMIVPSNAVSNRSGQP